MKRKSERRRLTDAENLTRALKNEEKEMERALDALVREQVYKRDGYRCLKCNTTKALTPSHIFPKGRVSRLRWEPSNILTLCAACHLYWWHGHPIEAREWLEMKMPGLIKSLVVMAAVAPKTDKKLLLAVLQAEAK